VAKSAMRKTAEKKCFLTIVYTKKTTPLITIISYTTIKTRYIFKR